MRAARAQTPLLSLSRTLQRTLFSPEELLGRIEANSEDETLPVGPRLHRGPFCGCLPGPHQSLNSDAELVPAKCLEQCLDL